MKQIAIEWQHLDKEGETCTRCSNTGENVQKVIQNLSKEFESNGIKLEFKETKLGENEIPQSNKIFFNGIEIEDIIPELKIIENACPSCSEILGKETCCRAVEYKGEINDEIPEALIKKAIMIMSEKIK